MVRAPFFDKNGLKKGAWSQEEDDKLRAYVQRYGHWNWRELPKFAGLSRCGKSCRLRWINYLRPGVKHGNYSKEEEDLIIRLHEQFGNKWSKIAAKLPGRTDNEIKNYWHSHLKRRAKKSESSNGMKEQCSTETLCEVSQTRNLKIESYIAKTPYSHPILESYPLSAEPSSSEVSHLSSADSCLVTASATSCNVEDRVSYSFETFEDTSGDFWTQPFVADQDGYILSVLDGGFTSPSFTSYDDSVDLFYQVMKELSGN
ncbi:hypothetical protein JCGZ_26464 [Jatropha curcas]|uniref:MYB family protein n=1 Tax=Jatropha curcas TaxID=180498 RepID=A0A067JXL7_JATCU|nr:transcription factor MYB4 [Jatropha curcas]AIT52287.1 MYB family protein [Jatropha curcas]KDP24725.1 hypothetical protein JCGZ_26464 [Jatropha curcas]